MATLIIPDQPNPSISQIVKPSDSNQGLFLGNYKAALDKQLLQKHKIVAVITLGKELIPPKGLRTMHIKIDDTPLSNILQHLPKCVKFISDNIKQGNVFVHCRAGISRSATVVIAYLIYSRNYSLEKALRNTKLKRQIVNPNPGFMMQLQVYEKNLKGKQDRKYGFSLNKSNQSRKENNSNTNVRGHSAMKRKQIDVGISKTNFKYSINSLKKSSLVAKKTILW